MTTVSHSFSITLYTCVSSGLTSISVHQGQAAKAESKQVQGRLEAQNATDLAFWNTSRISFQVSRNDYSMEQSDLKSQEPCTFISIKQPLGNTSAIEDLARFFLYGKACARYSSKFMGFYPLIRASSRSLGCSKDIPVHPILYLPSFPTSLAQKRIDLQRFSRFHLEGRKPLV